MGDMTTRTTPGSNRWGRIDWMMLLLFVILTVGSRLPFRSDYLFEGDSVNFALGMERYDVSEYRPHPPGYILYIGFAKVFQILIPDANQALIAVSILFSAIGMMFFYMLARLMFDRAVAVTGSLLFLTVPFFWFYGEVALSYCAGSCFSTMIAYCAYQVLAQKDSDRGSLWIYVSAALLGFAGGIRQDILMLMFPLVAYRIFRASPGLRTILRAGALFAVVTALWYVPMVLLSQGYAAYSKTTSDQFNYYVGIFSVLFGNPVLQHFKMIKDFLLLTFGAALVPFVCLCYYLIRRRRELPSVFAGGRGTFLAIWIVVPVLFFTVVYFHQPGYILIFLPALYLVCAALMLRGSYQWTGKNRQIRWGTGVQIAVATAFHVFLFFSSPIENNTTGAVGKPFEEKSWSEAIRGMTHTALFKHTRETILRNNLSTRAYIKGIRALPFDPDSIVLLTFNRAPWSYGLALYYLPEYPGYFIADYRTEVEKLRYWYNRELIDNVEGRPIRLTPSTKNVIVICSDDSPSAKELIESAHMRRITFEDGVSLYLIDEQPISIHYQGIVFTNSPES